MGQPKLTELNDFDSVFSDELEPGHTLMHGQYTIEEFLNAGGFGITYRARDSLDRIVVIKECFPGSLCRRTTTSVQARSRAHTKEMSSIVRLFVEEARSLARLDHPHIVGVHQVFEENNTAYMALDFVEGRDLLDMIEKPEDFLEPEEVEPILRKLLSAVAFIHDQGILHRDISPDNVLIQPNMEPILIDFGAAREEASKQSRILSAMRVVKDGYSPQEFYISGADQGPFSDLYALGATFYHLITGDLPANSQNRLAAVAAGDADPYVPVADRMPAYSVNFLKGIDKALQILPRDRIQSATDWLALLEGGNADTAKPSSAKGAEVTTAKSKKSRALLLGTVAMLAPILAGLVYSQTGGLSSDADPSAAAVQTLQTETTASVGTSAEAALVESTAIPEPDVVASLTATPQIAAPETPASSAEESLLAILSTPTEAPAVQDQTPVVQDPASIADILASTQPVAPAAPVTAETTAETVATTVADAPAVTVAAVPNDRFAPEAYTFVPVVEAPVAVASVPDSRFVPEAYTLQPPVAAAAIPNDPAAPEADTPEVVQDTVTAPPPQDIETYDLPQILTGWSMDVESALENPAHTIFEINGLQIGADDNIDTVLHQNFAVPFGGESKVTILVGSDQAGATYQTMIVPVVHNTLFSNGLAFETRIIDRTWTTTVVATPPASDFQVGDILVGDLASSLSFDARTTFPDLLVGAYADDLSSLTLAIRRGVGVVAINLNLPR